MANECWKIILLKGLEEINDEQFDMVKFLLTDLLNLTSKMQEEYNKVQIANLMVKKFREDAGVDKLIKLCKEIASLQAFVEMLKKEKAKVMRSRSTQAKGKTSSEKSKQNEDDRAKPVPTTSSTVTSEGAEVTLRPQKRKTTGKGKDGTKKSKVSEEQTQPSCLPGASTPTAIGHLPPPQTSADPSKMSSTKKPKPQAKDPAATKANYLQKGPMTVMVLSASDPFEYECSEKEKKKMFHAIVATEQKYFHMKVLNITLKKKFTRNKIIIISNYLEYKRLLEVNEASSVSEASPDQKIEVPKNIISRAKETLKIDVLQTQASGTIVYGLFMLCKKTVNKDNTIYEIKDDTGSMEVVGKGICHNIPCEEGDKLQLFCFQLRKKNEKSKLVSEMHSFIQVKKKPNQKNSFGTTMSRPEESSEIPKHTEGGATPIQSHLMTFLMPPEPSTSGFSIKKEEAASGTGISSAISSAGALPVSNPHISGTYQHTLSRPCQTSSLRAVSVTEGHQSQPIEVMVLKVTEPFVYEINEEKKMFHATVATESTFFQVKVFDVNLKEMFIPKKIIAISNYVVRNGFLEVYAFITSVLKVDADRKMEIPKSLIIEAGRTPKISDLHSQTEGKFVNGVFLVHKKSVMDKFTYYEIKDKTGQMEVVIYGRLTNIDCKEGDKLQLVCFELAPVHKDKCHLRSVIHSYMKVIKTRKIKKEILGPDSDMETSLDAIFQNLDAVNSDVYGDNF